MTPDAVKALGKLAFSQSIKPLTTKRRAKKIIVVGFDSEYDAQTRELLSLQFYHDGRGYFYVCRPGFKLTWQALDGLVLMFLKECGYSINKRWLRAIKLICWYSTAECQHIDNIKDATVVESSAGPDFRYRSGGRTLEIVDLRKFWALGFSLKRAADGFGLKKLDWERAKISRKDLLKKGFKEYAINDAYLTYEMFNRLRDQFLDYDADILLTRTSASTSATIYRNTYLTTKIEQDNVRLRRLALRANWGGRNECFWRGVRQDEIHEYDAFSEYPSSVIQLGALPNAADWCSLSRLEDQKYGIVRARFSFPVDCAFPCLPVFHNSRLCYPLSGESFCTLSEIRMATSLEADIEIIEGYFYSGGDSSLSIYMTDLLGERMEAEKRGDMVKYHVLKLALNSLIGKFVQRVEKIDLNTLIELERLTGLTIPELSKIRDVDVLAKRLGVGVVKKLSIGSVFMPEWNTLILGYARAATSNAFYQAGIVPLISSTDSVIAAGPKIPDFESNGIRFQHRMTGDRLTSVRTRLYAVEADGKIQKIAYHAIHRRDEAIRILRGWAVDRRPSDVYRASHLNSFREYIKLGKPYGAEVRRDMNVNLCYDNKRQLREDGSTVPWPTVFDIDNVENVH